MPEPCSRPLSLGQHALTAESMKGPEIAMYSEDAARPGVVEDPRKASSVQPSEHFRLRVGDRRVIFD